MSDEQIVKIQLKVGQSEIAYEGPISFLQNELLDFVKEATDCCKANTPSDDAASKETPLTPNKDKKLDLSMTTIASHLKVKSGPDLILAACAHLTFVEGKEQFPRKEILATMRDASGFYNKNHEKVLTRDLRRLIAKKSVNEISKNSYALHAEKKKELETQLSD